MNNCEKCGSRDFIVHEESKYQATIGEDGTLRVGMGDSPYVETNGYTVAECTNCHAQYPIEAFTDVDNV